MTTGGLEFLALVIGALSLFAGVLGWASWMEGRDKKRAVPVNKTEHAEATYPKVGQPTRRAF